IGAGYRIALRISTRLIEGAPPSKFTAASDGQVIYLAAPADELRDAWQRVANDLRGCGYVVFPPDGRLPDTVSKAEMAIREVLAKAVMSVHFLGESEGGMPDGSSESLTRLQLRLSREHCGASGRFPRVLRVPK